MKKVKSNTALKGDAFEIYPEDKQYPEQFRKLPDYPKKLYVVGNLSALREGLAVVGARKATPYGISCATHFASIAAKNGINIVSGGAFGCDSASHRAALSQKSSTIVFLGGGCNKIYPKRNLALFQKIIDNNGAVVSENEWNFDALPYTFLQRNRLIAGLAKAVLIVEAGLPSGTFTTADFAIGYDKEVLSVPGAITNENSSGCNKLIYDGAVPIINDDVFYEVLFRLFPEINKDKLIRVSKEYTGKIHKISNNKNPILNALCAQAMSVDELYELAKKVSKQKHPSVWLSEKLIEAEQTGRIIKYPNGMYGPVLKS